MATPLYCRKCGTNVPAESLFCAACGASQTGNDQVLTNQLQQEGAFLGTGRQPAGRLLHQRYRLLQTVGQGGMGAVYAAHDTQLGDRLVAVKEMSISRLAPQDRPQAVEQFRREAHLLASLHHPNLPVIHEYFQENERWYLVMSFIEGQNLQTVLRAAPSNKLPLTEVVRIGIELCDVLEYLHTHESQVIFRDLKPLNIMLTPKGRICLIDFGIARHFKQGQTKDTAYYYSVGYAPPEQYGQAQTGPRSDIYSLGATLHQMLSGQNPSEKPFQFVPLQLVDATLPASLATLIAQMLEMSEQARPASVVEVKAQLEQVLAPKRTEPIQPASIKQAVEQPLLPHLAIPESYVPKLLPNSVPLRVEEANMPSVRSAPQPVLEPTIPAISSRNDVYTPIVLPGHRFLSPIEEVHPSQPLFFQPDVRKTVKPVKTHASRRITLLGIVCLVILALASGIAWFAVPHGHTLATLDGHTLATLAVDITEFSPAIVQPDLGGITTGPDGNLWFTDNLGNQIGRITPSGEITEYPLPTSGTGSSPNDITTGPDGNLWFTETDDQIGRITPSGKITEYPLPTSGTGNDITTGPDGNLWFTETDDQIGRITPNGKITEYPLPISSDSSSYPNDITTGPDGNLWFTEIDDQIGRITPSGKITEFSLPTSGSSPNDITTGPDGNLWFTENLGNQIGRITPSGKITEFPIPTLNSGPTGITTGPDSNLWFTENLGNQIGRIGPSGIVTEYPLPTFGSGPNDIAAGPDGNLWFTESKGGNIGRIILSK